jgi:Ca2+-binding EF-hand superfamily protein
MTTSKSKSDLIQESINKIDLSNDKKIQLAELVLTLEMLENRKEELESKILNLLYDTDS